MDENVKQAIYFGCVFLLGALVGYVLSIVEINACVNSYNELLKLCGELCGEAVRVIPYGNYTI